MQRICTRRRDLYCPEPPRNWSGFPSEAHRHAFVKEITTIVAISADSWLAVSHVARRRPTRSSGRCGNLFVTQFRRACPFWRISRRRCNRLNLPTPLADAS